MMRAKKFALCVSTASALALSGVGLEATGASAASPVPLANVMSQADPGLDCVANPPLADGYDLTYLGAISATSSGQDADSGDTQCEWYATTGGDGDDQGPGGPDLTTVLFTAVNWQDACDRTTDFNGSQPSTAVQAGDGSWWCVTPTSS